MTDAATPPAPSPPAAPPPRPRRGWRWLLIASLALNALFIGAVVGGAIRHWRNPPGAMPGGELSLLWQALPGEAREALRGGIDDDRRGGREGRERMRGDLRDLRALLVAEPFDRAALEAWLLAARDRQAARADRALQRMLDRIAALPAAERARMAERLERRFRRFDRD
jgi:uncharacterized membrane protein